LQKNYTCDYRFWGVKCAYACLLTRANYILAFLMFATYLHKGGFMGRIGCLCNQVEVEVEVEECENPYEQLRRRIIVENRIRLQAVLQSAQR
jgi:hypothetical protein